MENYVVLYQQILGVATRDEKGTGHLKNRQVKFLLHRAGTIWPDLWVSNLILMSY